MLRRADRATSDLNVILTVFAVGLATLDLTCLVTLKVVSQLAPQVMRMADPSQAAQVPLYSFVGDPPKSGAGH